MPKHEHKHMSAMIKPFNKVPVKSLEEGIANQTPKDDGDVDSEKWNPTPEQFEAFLTRDEQLAVGNILMIMSARKQPMSIKEIKDNTLHSADVIERVLASGVETDSIVEAKGKYSLAAA